MLGDYISRTLECIKSKQPYRGVREHMCRGGGILLYLQNPLFFEKILIPFLLCKLFDHKHTSILQVFINYLCNFLKWIVV